MAGVEQPRDSGMVQRGQNAALSQKALSKRRYRVCRTSYFDGYAMFHLAVDPLGKVHLAHTSTTQRAYDPIWSADGRRSAGKILVEHRLSGACNDTCDGFLADVEP